MGSEFVFTSMLLLGCLVFVQFVTSQNECDCRAGCNLNETCYNSECTLKNVAVGKVANSSTVYSNQVPCLAVDGITNIDLCTGTAQHDLNPFWRVDLGQEFVVRFMTVYRRWHWSLRMVGLKIYVEDQLCDVIEENETTGNPSSVSSGSPVPISITCSTPLTGRYVTLVKNTTQVDLVYHRERLSVCEVQVWGTMTQTTTTTTTTSPATPPPPPTATEQTKSPVAVIAGAGGAGVAVVTAIAVGIIFKRRKRGSTSKKEPAMEFEAQEPTATVVAERDTSVTEHTTTTRNVDENTEEETGNDYSPLSHKDNHNVNDNTQYTTPVFKHSETGEGASMAASGVAGTASLGTTDNVYEVIGDGSGKEPLDHVDNTHVADNTQYVNHVFARKEEVEQQA